MKARRLIALTSLLSLLPLAACNHLNENRANNFESLTQQQQAKYWAAKKIQALITVLQQRGVQVYAVGDDYQLIVPANNIFIGNTPAYNSSAKGTFQAITHLINAQSTPSIRIEGYANNSKSKDRNYALAKSWADTVQDELRQSGLATGVVYTEAYGQCDNIGSDRLNNRIEIHYRVSHDD